MDTTTEGKRRGNPNWTKGGPSPNPQGRMPRADGDAKLQGPVVTDKERRDHARWMELAYKSDGWYNLLTGHGTATRDKSYSTRFYTDVITESEGRELWRGDDLAARIVEAFVDEMLREPFRVCIPDDATGNIDERGKELIDKVEHKWEELGARDVLHEALCMERALGGSTIVLGADDGAVSLEEPLNEKRVKTFDWLTVLEPREVQPVSWYMNPRAPKFGQVEIYQLTPVTTGVPRAGVALPPTITRVHESRLIMFKGIRVSRVNQWGTATGWGDNVFTRVYRVLRDFNASFSGAGILAHEFATPVFKIKGLADIIAKDNKELFQARMQALALAMSTARAALIDSEEEYKREQTPVTGLAELLELLCKRLAAAANTPVSILFGEAPGGLNASGAQGDQLQIWNNRVRSGQTRKVAPPLRKITSLIMRVFGGEPDKWWLEFDPLHSPSEKEEAETEKLEADTVCAYYDRGILSEEEIRRMPGFAKKYGITLMDTADVTSDPTAVDVAAYIDPNAPPVNPNDPNAAITATGAAGDLQKEAFNGAQVSALIEVVTAVAGGLISRQSAQKMLELAFQLSSAEALALIGPEGFEPTKPDPAPAPGGGFGGGFPPKAAPPADKVPPAKV